MAKTDRSDTIAESLVFGLALAFSGGLMDAYSYLFRGGVFANAQTGNILLFAVNLTRGEWIAALGFLTPVAAFSVGITISYLLKCRFPSGRSRRVFALAAEILLFAVVAFVPQSQNNVANALISLACGIQLEAFGVINANNVATTMCIGNLRCAIENLLAGCVKSERGALRKAGVYAAVICAFAVGAAAGGGLIALVGSYAIIACAATVAVCLALVAFAPPGIIDGRRGAA